MDYYKLIEDSHSTQDICQTNNGNVSCGDKFQMEFNCLYRIMNFGIEGNLVALLLMASVLKIM
jgi:hypothetical protein